MAYAAARTLIDENIKTHGNDKPVGFPDTAFYLPLIYAVLGEEVATLGDAKRVLETAGALLKPVPSGKWENPLDDALNGGVVTAISAEVIEAVKYLSPDHPGKGWQGFIQDSILRGLGLQLVDGRMSGVAVIVGSCSDPKTAVNIIRGLQGKNILSLLIGSSNGVTMREQLEKEHVEMGLHTYIVPAGPDTTSVIYAANFAVRAALTFGGFKKGQAAEVVNYCRDRVPAFCLVLGPVDEVKVAAGFAALKLGFPLITDQGVPAIGKIPTTKYEALVPEKDHSKILQQAIQTSGIKIKVQHIDIPVAYSAAFEGERVRRNQMYVQFGGKFSTAFEFVQTKELSKVEDGVITVKGLEIDGMKEGEAYPLGIYVEVAGRNMHEDFEPILERQIHSFLNEAQGIFHMGQRSMCWIRISREAVAKGFKIKHFGIIIHARIHELFSKIVDKVRVTLYTEDAAVKDLLPEATKAYDHRDARIAGMTDESVDTFYSCALCQSFAPNHICIVKPERSGLCGAYSWLDAKACYELNPIGPNQPVKKGEVIDKNRGEWKGINDFIYQKSNKTLARFHAYSIMTFPETSCGCFECVISVLPEANGFMVINREYTGMTPAGMKFSTLASSVGGGNQTPGFMGVGRLYIVSRKFLSADGGLKRLVWMPKELKTALKDKLIERCKEEGMPELYDMIADETVAVDSAALLTYLEKVGHPALKMDPLL